MPSSLRRAFLALSLLVLISGCAHERGALPPPVILIQPDTARVRKPEGPAFPSASLDTLLTSPVLTGATIAIEVVSLPGEETLYATNPDRLLTPASVQKLFTSAACLYWLSPQFRFKTELRWDRQDLFLVGSGDPSLTLTDLRELAKEARRNGVLRARHLILDLSRFDSLAANPAWPTEDARFTYQPPLSPLSCQHNVVMLRVAPVGSKGALRIEIEPRSPSLKVRSKGAVAAEDHAGLEVHQRKTAAGILFEMSGKALHGGKPETLYRNVSDPAWFTGLLLKDALKGEGIILRGKLLKGETAPPEAGVVAIHRSQALADLLRTMNKESDNLYAEQMLKALGAERYGPPGSAEKGIQAVQAFLDTLGVKPGGCRMVDGSGLSRANSLSAEALVKVLAWMYKQFRLSPEFVSSLPVAGGDGTLGKRLSQFPGLSRAKTGTLTAVSSLAGYAVNRRGEVVAFAILVNGYTASASEIRSLQDEVVKRIVAW